MCNLLDTDPQTQDPLQKVRAQLETLNNMEALLNAQNRKITDLIETLHSARHQLLAWQAILGGSDERKN